MKEPLFNEIQSRLKEILAYEGVTTSPPPLRHSPPVHRYYQHDHHHHHGQVSKYNTLKKHFRGLLPFFQYVYDSSPVADLTGRGSILKHRWATASNLQAYLGVLDTYYPSNAKAENRVEDAAGTLSWMVSWELEKRNHDNATTIVVLIIIFIHPLPSHHY